MVVGRRLGPIGTGLSSQGLELAASTDQTRQHRLTVQAMMERVVVRRTLLRWRLTDRGWPTSHDWRRWKPLILLVPFVRRSLDRTLPPAPTIAGGSIRECLLHENRMGFGDLVRVPPFDRQEHHHVGYAYSSPSMDLQNKFCSSAKGWWWRTLGRSSL